MDAMTAFAGLGSVGSAISGNVVWLPQCVRFSDTRSFGHGWARPRVSAHIHLREPPAWEYQDPVMCSVILGKTLFT